MLFPGALLHLTKFNSKNRQSIQQPFKQERSKSTMMIFTVAVVLGTLLSSTQAKPLALRPKQVMGVSLGDTFLAIAKNYTAQSDRPLTQTKSASFSLEMQASAIKPLAAQVDVLCDQQGKVSSKSQTGNDTVTTSYSLSCSLTKEKYDVYEAAVTALLKAAQDNSTSYTFYTDTSSSSFDGYYGYGSDPSLNAALQKALETLMAEADTIEEVMLVFSSWQSFVTSYGYYSSIYPTPTSSISVSLSQKYEFFDSVPISSTNDTDDM
jgi:hypothetical protein